MAKLRYRTEKDLIIEQLWQIVNRTLEIDDAGCDWFTVGHFTYIANLGWRVSEDEEVAKLVGAINCLNGYPELNYRRFEDVPEHMKGQNEDSDFWNPEEF